MNDVQKKRHNLIHLSWNEIRIRVVACVAEDWQDVVYEKMLPPSWRAPKVSVAEDYD